MRDKYDDKEVAFFMLSIKHLSDDTKTAVDDMDAFFIMFQPPFKKNEEEYLRQVASWNRRIVRYNDMILFFPEESE